MVAVSAATEGVVSGASFRTVIERIIREQSGHVPVPIEISAKAGEAPSQLSDGTALWTRSKGEVSEADYADFYRGISGQYDEPALTVHFRAEGRHGAAARQRRAPASGWRHRTGGILADRGTGRPGS